MPSGMRKIVVDADACPVKEEILNVARKFEIEAVFVASFDHYIAPASGATVIQVDRSAESADLYIANQIRPNDVVVTQDFGLATIALAKRAIVISNRGQRYTDQSIEFLLEARHTLAKNRRQGRYGKGPRPFSDDDRNKFQHVLTKILLNLQEITPS